MNKSNLKKRYNIPLPCYIALYSAVTFSFSVIAEEDFIHDRIEVTGRAPAYQQSLSKVLPQQQIIEPSSFSSDSVAALFSQTPAINLNGQGGLFQTINIRGFARWRIQTLVEGIPIYSERRAGSSVEFLPPAFLGQAYLTQGAASTQLGSGAIGGGIDLRLAQPDDHKINLNYGHRQDYREVTIQGSSSIKSNYDDLSGSDTLSWQLNHRHANNSKDANNDVIQDSFEHHSLVLRHHSNNGVVQDALLLMSAANNIGKASADDPQDRLTLYPENTHILGKLTLDWHNATAYFHDSTLQTLITRPGRRISNTFNDSLDVGLQFHDQLQYQNWQIHWRVGLNGRTGVKAFETEVDDNNEDVFARLNLHAEQWEYSIAADTSRNFDSHHLAGGVRLAHQIQKDKLVFDLHEQQADPQEQQSQKLQSQQLKPQQSPSQKDSNLSAFLGYGCHLDEHWKWSAYVSNAYRVPSLTERYFNGSTPRGTISGDANLQTETATNIETSIAFAKDDFSASISLFQQDIDNYIERLTVNDESDTETFVEERRQYRNLEQAEISGINYEIQYEFDSDFLFGNNFLFGDSLLRKNRHWNDLHWILNAGGQWLNGEDKNGNPVADISPAQHNFTLSFYADNSDGFITVTHRQSSNDIVSGELPTNSVTTVDAGYSLHINDKTKLTLNITNLTDQHYVTSRDDLAPFARGREVHVSLGVRF